MTERAKIPLKKALELDDADPDANAALGLVFQAEMEPELADQHFRKALSSRPADARILNNYGSFLSSRNATRTPMSALSRLRPIRCILSVRVCSRTLA